MNFPRAIRTAKNLSCDQLFCPISRHTRRSELFRTLIEFRWELCWQMARLTVAAPAHLRNYPFRQEIPSIFCIRRQQFNNCGHLYPIQAPIISPNWRSRIANVRPSIQGRWQVRCMFRADPTQFPDTTCRRFANASPPAPK